LFYATRFLLGISQDTEKEIIIVLRFKNSFYTTKLHRINYITKWKY